MENIKLIAFDLDGTLTYHKTMLEAENKAMLKKLSENYRLVIVGAGACMRIFRQIGEFPIDVLANYGMQDGRYNCKTKTLDIKETRVDCDREEMEKRISEMRKTYGFTAYSGDSVMFHASGCITVPLLGTEADVIEKLEFDPDRSRRRAVYADVCRDFSDYNVFIGGSSSFDLVPHPYDKRYALERYAAELGICTEEIVYVGDDYGMGGNDESVYLSGIRFIKADDPRHVPELLREQGLL